MIHSYPKANKICIWYRKPEKGDTKIWELSPMEPTWWAVVGWPWYQLNNGDEIEINKECDVDFSGRVIIKDGIHILVRYSDDEDVKVKINIVPRPEPENESEKLLWEEYDRRRRERMAGLRR